MGYSAVEGFHVTSFQADFASHHTCDRHVGFLFARYCKTQQNAPFLLFSSFDIIKYQLSDKNIRTHTRLKFQIPP